MRRNIPYKRTDRVSAQIFEVLSESFYTDFALNELCEVQLTRVDVSSDLRNAKLYYHVLNADEEKLEQVHTSMEQLRGKFRYLVASQVKLKYIPEFKIYYDKGVDASARIDELLSGGV